METKVQQNRSVQQPLKWINTKDTHACTCINTLLCRYRPTGPRASLFFGFSNPFCRYLVGAPRWRLDDRLELRASGLLLQVQYFTEKLADHHSTMPSAEPTSCDSRRHDTEHHGCGHNRRTLLTEHVCFTEEGCKALTHPNKVYREAMWQSKTHSCHLQLHIH